MAIPAVLSDDRTSVTTSVGDTWIHVKRIVETVRGKKQDVYCFVRDNKVNELDEVVPLKEHLGVMENKLSHVPLKTSLSKLKRLLEVKYKKEKQNE